MGFLVGTHIPDVWKLTFFQVPAEGWVINMDEHSLLGGPGNAMCLPLLWLTVHNDRMPQGLVMLVDGGGGCEVFFESIPKGPSRFPNTFLLTICLGAFVPADYPHSFV